MKIKTYSIKNILEIKKSVLKNSQNAFKYIDEIAEFNTNKVLNAFRKCRVSEMHFNISSGYAYDDIGRTKLDELYAEVLGAEKSLVRTQLVSGTHALATVLFGILRPNDEIVSITGKPYDTMKTVIGHEYDSEGSLKEFGIKYKELSLVNGAVDEDNLHTVVDLNTRMAILQRSKGYEFNRKSLSIVDIKRITHKIKNINPDCICFVDNCYGEFVCTEEPTNIDTVDIIAGSLIKNIGGGIAPTGGYIAGKKSLVQKSGFRLTAPGIGNKQGATLVDPRMLYQGLFLAPHIVAQATKTAIFTAGMFEELGYKVCPLFKEDRYDIIQAVELKTSEQVISFCQAIQKYSPVDAFTKPEPWYMPGYKDEIIMAAGTFVQGASIELSADAPIKPPYAVYLQGGLIFEHALIAIPNAINEMLQR